MNVKLAEVAEVVEEVRPVIPGDTVAVLRPSWVLLLAPMSGVIPPGFIDPVPLLLVPSPLLLLLLLDWDG